MLRDMDGDALEMARLARARGHFQEALACYESAIPAAVRLGSPASVAEIFLHTGDLHRERGDLELAAEAYGVSLAIGEAHRDDVLVARALTRLGSAMVALGNPEEAADRLDRARHLAAELELPELRGEIELSCTALHASHGEVQRALECCEQAFELHRCLRSARGLSEAHRWYGFLFRAKAQGKLARAHLGAAVEAARACGDPRLEAEALREWAAFHLAAGRHRESLQSLNQAYRLYADESARGVLPDLDLRLDLLEEDYLHVVRAWAELVESKDRYTTGHCERVASHACMLARQLGIRGRELAWVQMGAYLHDIGKLAIPAEVLNRPGGLSPDEWAGVQQHTVEGDEVIAALNLPWDIRSMVRSHHERWDGYGYPDGLAGEAIPLTARIVCLADVYDALTIDRSFREAFPRDEALRIMDGEVGRIFDPRLFALFRSLVLGRGGRDGTRPRVEPRRASAA